MTRTRRTALAATLPAAGALALLAAAVPSGAAGPAAPAGGSTGAGAQLVAHATPQVPVQVAAEVAAAVRAGSQVAAVPAEAYAVTRVRTAASDPAWAAAELAPADPTALDPATVVLHRTGEAWAVVSLGTAGVGCEEAPAPVAADLALLC
ncbi:hypothetical protein MO973_17255 [Paenibacillus sp. TRM 82003]|uniref:hypothetical protein n=1 Tax=Kineococcus sp. TRM81007 TaxID=2925831 RepID=UPI001F5AFEC8|nr:hypothetical protein [Kineococcus sp. TRM81007]MCI2238508.1 hypothetical protein [Kineococcus sp. TRM81007]MCI3921979.1 hypothetical protein [Paenibacillus sp. TRM 82003]